ncbi:MAG: formylglycine-generating enzyme family protein [Adhaeribacter sp.]
MAGLQARAQAPELTNAAGMRFVLIQPGSLVVGRFEPGVGQAPAPQAGQRHLPAAAYEQARQLAKQSSLPGFTVQIAKAFYLGRYEVTQAQWEKVMGRNPSFFNSAKIGREAGNHPVEQVSWKDARAFVKKLNKQDKQYHYRLPTEFEWEYAARAGAAGDISWSDINRMAVLGGSHPLAVGQKQPNAWGLYDMLGNVWEWVDDYYNEKIFADPVPPRKGKQHVLKGASFTGDVKNATYMTHAAGPGNGFDIGLRLVMEVKQEKDKK